VIAAVMVAYYDAHHAEFDRVPARDDVQPKPPVTDVIRRHHLLGGKYRIDERDMERAERRDVFRRSQQPAGPGQRLECRALGIAFTLIAVPAADRQQKFEA